MRILYIYGICTVLLAAPLAAQQTVVVPDVNVEVEPTPITNEVNVEVMSDSVRLARIADAMESLAEAIAECGCVEQGPSTVNVVSNAALTLAAFFIGWQLKGIKDNGRPSETPEVPEEQDSESYGEN